MNVLSHGSAKKKTKRLVCLKCCSFIRLFLSGIMAVKGLTALSLWSSLKRKLKGLTGHQKQQNQRAEGKVGRCPTSQFSPFNCCFVA